MTLGNATSVPGVRKDNLLRSGIISCFIQRRGNHGLLKVKCGWAVVGKVNFLCI